MLDVGSNVCMHVRYLFSAVTAQLTAIIV